MATKAAKKIVDALSQLMEGYTELRESVVSKPSSKEVDEDDADDEGEESTSASDEALVTEMRNALEAVMDSDDYSAEDFAATISYLTEALEEIDPDVFTDTAEEEGEDESLYGDNEDYSDDDLDNIDDDDDDYYDDDEEEEDDEEEDEEDDDDDDEDDDE